VASINIVKTYIFAITIHIQAALSLSANVISYRLDELITYLLTYSTVQSPS